MLSLDLVSCQASCCCCLFLHSSNPSQYSAAPHSSLRPIVSYNELGLLASCSIGLRYGIHTSQVSSRLLRHLNSQTYPCRLYSRALLSTRFNVPNELCKATSTCLRTKLQYTQIFLGQVSHHMNVNTETKRYDGCVTDPPSGTLRFVVQHTTLTQCRWKTKVCVYPNFDLAPRFRTTDLALDRSG